MSHETYIEHLYHYLCYKCKKWWSISEGTDSDFAICPHCGHKDVTEYKLEDQRERQNNKGIGL